MTKLKATLILAVIVNVAAIAEAPISLASQVLVATEPADFRIVITVPKSAENRVVCVAADGGEYHQSCWQWDGENGPYVKEMWLKRLTEGTYIIVGVVQRRDGSQSMAKLQLEVTGKGAPFVR